MLLTLLLGLLLQEPTPKELLTIPGSKVTLALVSLPGDGTLHPFAIGVHEVSWGQLRLFTETEVRPGVDAVTRPSNALSYFGEVIPQESREPKMPATNLRWHAAVQYCEWLSRKTGRYFRLPTEREWEYAARAGDAGEAPAGIPELAWCAGNAKRMTHPGGLKKPNAFGLHDMLGNLWEYCLEFDAPPVYGPVLRGGCWSTPPEELNYASRRLIPKNWFLDDCVLPRSVWWLGSDKAQQGFRVVCVAGAADVKEREAGAARLEIKILDSKEDQGVSFEGATADLFCKVSGELRNTSGRTIDELELAVFYLTPDGKPLWTDDEGSKPHRASFGKCWPVLPNGVHAGAERAPLKPGETRVFALYLPSLLVPVPGVTKKFGGSVTNLRFAKE